LTYRREPADGRKVGAVCPVFVSITVQTYNRSAVLAEMLESLHALRCPQKTDYEILIVDNNSSDDTQDVVRRYREILGSRVRGAFEPRQGLSHARNRAWREAKGGIVSFLDDDVKVDPAWLEAVAAAFECYAPAVVGGKSYLIYPFPRPSWLPEFYESLLSRLDYGDRPIVNVEQPLFGLNLSVQKEWLERAGGFDTSLGRRGRYLSSGEEFDLLQRIRARGGVAVYEPKAVVGHMVAADRLTKRWFAKRLFAAGRDSVVLAVKEGASLPSVSGAAIHAIRCCGSILKNMVRGDFSSERVFAKELAAAHALGSLDSRIRLAITSRL
jgi:glycosyltransferase involved in cell wall biosynthesis